METYIRKAAVSLKTTGKGALYSSAGVEAGREWREGRMGECQRFTLPPAGLSPGWSFPLTLYFNFHFIISASPSGHKSYMYVYSDSP